MANSVRYRTLGGDPLELAPYLQSGAWPAVAGIYCFAYHDGGTWRVMYVGQASSFADRIPSHERWPEANRGGATHVLAMAVSTQAARDRIEAALIRELQPPLNTQLR